MENKIKFLKEFQKLILESGIASRILFDFIKYHNNSCECGSDSIKDDLEIFINKLENGK